MDVLQRDDLPFPRSLPEFREQLFPDEAKCAAYMEKARTALPLAIPSASSRCLSQVPPRYGPDGWAPSWNAAISVEHMVLGGLFGRQPDARHLGEVQFGLSRYETAFGILHKNSALLKQDFVSAASRGNMPIEIEHGLVDGLAAIPPQGSRPCAVFVFGNREPRRTRRKDGRLPGVSGFEYFRSRRLALWVRGERRCSEDALTVTDDWPASMNTLALPNPARSPSENVALGSITVCHQHRRISMSSRRFNRRFYPFNAFRSLLASRRCQPTFDELYSGEWEQPRCCG